MARVLTGTGEVALMAQRADEILEEDELPLKYATVSTCFRREAGAASDPDGAKGPGEASGGSPGKPLGTLKRALEGPEKRIIQRALALNGGNRKRTAELLGVNRTTLFNKMRKYDLLDTPSRG